MRLIERVRDPYKYKKEEVVSFLSAGQEALNEKADNTDDALRTTLLKNRERDNRH